MDDKKVYKKILTEMADEFKAYVLESVDEGYSEDLSPIEFIEMCAENFVEMKYDEKGE